MKRSAPLLAHALLPVLSLCALTAASSACQGRDPHAGDRAPIDEEPPPSSTVRTLARGAPLFGTMPVDNRFQDPLLTFTGAGWYTYSNDYRSYGNVVRVVGDSPTKTPFLLAREEDNRQGVTVLGQLKTSQAPLHVEAWLGAEGEDGDFEGFDVQLAGLFADGSEGVVALQGDDSTRLVIDGRTWQRFSVEVESGPIGWAMVLATALSTFAFGGPVGVALPAMPSAALIGAKKRPLNERERLLIEAVRERTRTLSVPRRL